MKKIRLNVEALDVRSFETAVEAAPRSGTVAAYVITRLADTCQPVTANEPSCYTCIEYCAAPTVYRC